MPYSTQLLRHFIMQVKTKFFLFLIKLILNHKVRLMFSSHLSQSYWGQIYVTELIFLLLSLLCPVYGWINSQAVREFHFYHMLSSTHRPWEDDDGSGKLLYQCSQILCHALQEKKGRNKRGRSKSQDFFTHSIALNMSTIHYCCCQTPTRQKICSNSTWIELQRNLQNGELS